MRCPYCAGENTQVKDSRPTEENAAIRRRRVCPDCGGRFTTFERVQLRELLVVKRSGRKVAFDRDKLCIRSRWRCASGRSRPSASSAWCRASCASSKARARARSRPRPSASSSWRPCAGSIPCLCALCLRLSRFPRGGGLPGGAGRDCRRARHAARGGRISPSTSSWETAPLKKH